MGIPLYLAMTAAEFRHFPPLATKTAWLSCLFSPYGAGLSNIPRYLPEKALLILSDRTPPCGHDPQLVCAMLYRTLEHLKCCAVLLDFQHDGCEEIVKAAASLPCKVAVTERYANIADCAVFLSAPPLQTPLEKHLKPWQDREIWLEAAYGSQTITVTETGSKVGQSSKSGEYPFYDDKLHCRYRTEIYEEHIVFHLYRGKKELGELLAHAEDLGITQAVGLYQELGR